ncbi:MAG: hypothetical protein KA170_01570 [Candidatus Promineofilum sp.]|nr:hypothetical protein [Promineifilum sp.]
MNKRTHSPPGNLPADDRILPLTRALAAAVIPFLVAAFVILYIAPQSTSRLFAWEIASPLTAALMGAGYLGGAYFFGRVLTGQGWHHVGVGFPSVAVLTLVLLAATLLHWDTFDPGHWPFQVWLVIYALTPILVPIVWWRNQPADPGTPETGDVPLPPAVSRFMVAAGILLLLGAAFLFLRPAAAVALWPWPLTPLTARVVAGWGAVLAVGALMLGRERRWSAWRIPFQSILLWQLLMAAAFVLRRPAFGPAGLFSWFTLFTVGGILVAAGFYRGMERRRTSL